MRSHGVAHPDTPGARPFLCCPCGSSLFTRQQNKPSTAKQKQKGPKTHKTKTCTCLVSLCLSVEKPRHSEKNKQNAWYGVIPQVSTTGKGAKKKKSEQKCLQSVCAAVCGGRCCSATRPRWSREILWECPVVLCVLVVCDAFL